MRSDRRTLFVRDCQKGSGKKSKEREKGASSNPLKGTAESKKKRGAFAS